MNPTTPRVYLSELNDRGRTQRNPGRIRTTPVVIRVNPATPNEPKNPQGERKPTTRPQMNPTTPSKNLSERSDPG